MKNFNNLSTLLVATFYLLFLTFNTSAQNIGINSTGADPDASALLDLNATDKGFLITRNEPTDITSPAFGLMTLAPSDSCLYMFSGRVWIGLGGVGNTCTNNGDSLFICGNPFVDKRDGINYGTVQIKEQCWMSENLNYTPSSGKFWCYNNSPSNCDIYGKLYDWNTAVDNKAAGSVANPSGIQGVCPTGWHVPSDEEWIQLEMAVGMSSADANSIQKWRGSVGAALKVEEWNGTNSSGFSGLPGGYWIPSVFENAGYTGYGGYGNFWTTTVDEGNISNAVRRVLNNKAGQQNQIYRGVVAKVNGYSLRCVKD